MEIPPARIAPCLEPFPQYFKHRRNVLEKSEAPGSAGPRVDKA